MDSKLREKRVLSWLLISLMVGIVLSPLSAHAADSDGDGVDSAVIPMGDDFGFSGTIT
ncbi:MAG: hypothetical protein VXV71_03400 [Candidatus Thermoplasmatota archaeon]|nr:hypothetical protein [Candidatus Thermoplasmatota archaeon]